MLVVVFLGDSSRRSINVNTSNPVGNNLEKVQDGSMDNGKERGEKKGRRIEKKRGRMKWEKRYNFSQSVRYLGGGGVSSWTWKRYKISNTGLFYWQIIKISLQRSIICALENFHLNSRGGGLMSYWTKCVPAHF